EAGVVELQVPATLGGDGRHLVCVGIAQVVPEQVDVGIDGWVQRGRTSPVVDHARRGDRQLGRRRGHLFLQVREVVGEDRLPQVDPLVDDQGGRLEGQLALVV